MHSKPNFCLCLEAWIISLLCWSFYYWVRTKFVRLKNLIKVVQKYLMLLHELIYLIISFTGRSITTFYQIYFNFLVALSFIRPYYFTLKLNIRNVRNASSILHTLKERISIDLVFKAISIKSIHLFFITILQGKLLSEICG